MKDEGYRFKKCETILVLNDYNDGELTTSGGREFHRNGWGTYKKKECLKLLILEWLHESFRLCERKLHKENEQ